MPAPRKGGSMPGPRRGGLRKKVRIPEPSQIRLQIQFVPYSGKPIPPKRGMLQAVPPAQLKSLTKLKIRENPDGSVRLPWYRVNERTNELELVGHRTFPDVNAAMRSMGWHVPKGIQEELLRLQELHNQLGRYHGKTAEHWNSLSPAQQQQLAREIRTTISLLSKNPDLLRSAPKVKAYQRISQAAEKLNQGNPMAALYSLIGAANDVVQRMNYLVGQKEYTPRREEALREFKTERERVVFVGLRQLVGEFGKVRRLSGLSRGDRIHFLKTIDAWKRYFGAPQRAKIQNYRLAAEQLQTTYTHALHGRFLEAEESFRQATRLIALEISKTGDLYGDMIQLVGQSRDKRWTQQIMRQQAQLVHDNLEYWTAKGFPTGFGDRPAFFTEWSKVANNSQQPSIARSFIRARTAYNIGDMSACKQALKKIVKQIVP